MQSKRIKNVEIFYCDVETDGKIIRLCPCRDAELFSEEALRILLLGDNGREVKCAAAISIADSLTVRLVSID